MLDTPQKSILGGHPQQAYPEPDKFPKAFERRAEDPLRFEEPEREWFWAVINWVYAAVIVSMGLCALRDMMINSYNWYVALLWMFSAISGLAGLAYIDKWHRKR